MLGEVFYWVFNMSIAGALAGAGILLLGRINGIPRRVIALLWGIPFLRLWLPFGLASDYGLMALLTKLGTKTVVVYQWAEDPAMTMANFAAGAKEYFPIVYKTNLLEGIFTAAGVVWLMGVSVLILTYGILYAVSMRQVKAARHWKQNVYVSETAVSAAVYGILRPRIVLPETDRDTRFVLLHEKTHIRRGDNFWRLLGFVTAAVHWFNPLVWLFLKQYLEQMELACDEAVLAGCTKDERKAYAHSLLDWEQSKSVFASAFGGAGIRVRVERILSYEKLSVLSAVCFGLLVIVVAYVLLTNAK